MRMAADFNHVILADPLEEARNEGKDRQMLKKFEACN